MAVEAPNMAVDEPNQHNKQSSLHEFPCPAGQKHT